MDDKDGKDNLKERMLRLVGFAVEKSWPGVESALAMMSAGSVAKPLPIRIGLAIDARTRAVKVTGVAVKPPVGFTFSDFPESKAADPRQLLLPGVTLDEADEIARSADWHPKDLEENDPEWPFWRSLKLAAVEAQKNIYFAFDDQGTEVERWEWRSGCWNTYKCPLAKEALDAATNTGEIVFYGMKLFNWHILRDDFRVYVPVARNQYRRFTGTRQEGEAVTKDELRRAAMEEDVIDGYGADYFREN